MPISWNVSDRGRVDVVFSNPYTLEGAEKVMKEIFASPAPLRPLRLLVDVRQTVAPDTEFVVNAINFWQLHVDKMWDAKVAVVTANKSQLDMAQMSERSAESRELPFRVQVFLESQHSEAERWLGDE